MKYVILEKSLGNGLVQIIPVIFPNVLVHADVAKAITEVAGGTVKAVSAGEVKLDVISCGDKSETLGLSPRPQDADIIKCIDYFSIGEES